MAKNPNDKPEEISIAQTLLIQEVNDEVRAEKLQQLWQKFGSWVVGGAVVVVLVTVVYQWSTAQMHQAQATATGQFLAADKLLESGQKQAAITQLTELADADADGVSALAKLRLLTLEAAGEEGDIEDSLLQDMASLKAGNFDAILPDSPYFPLAQELAILAGADAAEQGAEGERLSPWQRLSVREDIAPSQQIRLEAYQAGMAK